MDTLIYICAIFGLAFFLKESDGPWGLMASARNTLMTNKDVGVFFYKLLDCYFCLGFHCGWFVYLLQAQTWHFNLLICWGLAGGIISLIFDKVLVKLSEMPEPAKAPRTARKKI